MTRTLIKYRLCGTAGKVGLVGNPECILRNLRDAGLFYLIVLRSALQSKLDFPSWNEATRRKQSANLQLRRSPVSTPLSWGKGTGISFYHQRHDVKWNIMASYGSRLKQYGIPISTHCQWIPKLILPASHHAGYVTMLNQTSWTHLMQPRLMTNEWPVTDTFLQFYFSLNYRGSDAFAAVEQQDALPVCDQLLEDRGKKWSSKRKRQVKEVTCPSFCSSTNRKMFSEMVWVGNGLQQTFCFIHVCTYECT